MARSEMIVADLSAALDEPRVGFTQDNVARRDVPVVRIWAGDANLDASGGDAGEPIGERRGLRRRFRPKPRGGGEARDQRSRACDARAVERRNRRGANWRAVEGRAASERSG